ncbi:hypothetical protein RDWZM_002725 [Blomia tropicalis]|uniref:Calcium channel flower n=1 Tax=Blomia tropicalis TaxID=40697 RepID=A0A9Q0MID0_BLOTA|nr:hypothetical protein RDWZM_002725 [Blomia tropicalis]
MYPNLDESQTPQQQPPQSFWQVCGRINLQPFWRCICSLIVLTIEAPSFVPCLGFARPIGELIDRRPPWVKATVYGLLVLLPFILCGITTGISLGVFFIIGVIANLGLFIIYAKAILGEKANRDLMRAGAGGGGVFP